MSHPRRSRAALLLPSCLIPPLFLLLAACSAGAPGVAPPLDVSLPQVPAPGAEPTPVVEEAVLPPAEEAPSPQEAGPLAGRRVCLDPGHDAYWAAGASGRTRSGAVPRHPVEQVPLHEHELTLRIAYKLKALLEDEGAAVCVTRAPPEAGGALQLAPYDFTGDGRVRPFGLAVEDVPEITQPRIDWANSFGAEVLLSVHFNGIGDPRVRGTEVYYSDAGPRQAEARRLGESVLAALIAELRQAGHAAIDRGLRSDRYQRYSAEETRRLIAHNAAQVRANGHDPANCYDCLRLVILGNNPMSLQRGNYAGALVEVEFLSNPDVVEAFLLRADSLDVIARGLHRGLRSYFEGR